MIYYFSGFVNVVFLLYLVNTINIDIYAYNKINYMQEFTDRLPYPQELLGYVLSGFLAAQRVSWD